MDIDFVNPWHFVSSVALFGIAIEQVVTVWGFCTHYLVRHIWKESKAVLG